MEANEFSDRLWNFAADVGRFIETAKEINPLLDEANQLFRMLAKSASTAQKKGDDSAELNS